MTGVDAVTVGAIITWAVFAVPSLFIGTVAVRYGRRWLGNRRKDREWAARVAARTRETEALERLYATESAGERP